MKRIQPCWVNLLTLFSLGISIQSVDPQAQAEDKFPLKSKALAKLSPVIGVHTGPGTVGMAYYFE